MVGLSHPPGGPPFLGKQPARTASSVSFASPRIRCRNDTLGMRGRKPKPSALKLLAGNPGKRALNKREPRPRREIPSPPAHLSDGARTAWGALSTRLDRLG